jgi:ParB-like chromosome segregation protein Spo0J
MKRTKALTKAKALVKQIDALQSKLYSYSDDLQRLGFSDINRAQEAGFELDESRNKMEDLIGFLQQRPRVTPGNSLREKENN